MRLLALSSALALAATTTYAQTAKYCPATNVCYQVNIPDATASSGSGDIFFQISAPTSYQWVALGQGNGMSGAQIFVMYASASGTNVTISPRLGRGHIMPNFNSAAQVELLEGSGISNGIMTANVRCSSCKSWSGGSMDFTSTSAGWMYGIKQGSALNSDSQSAAITQHDTSDTFAINLATARGGSSSNPFISSTSDGTGSGSGSGSGSGNDSNSSGNSGVITSGGSASMTKTIIMAHGIIASLCFVILFPLGGMWIRLLSFKGLVWFHAGWQIFTFTALLTAFGMGIWLATDLKLLNDKHPIIGILVVCLVLFQIFLGVAHHLMFKRYRKRTFWSYGHIWLGRSVITLGMINGGFGLQLANNTKSGKVAYAVVAVIMWIAFVGSSIFGEYRRSKSAEAQKEQRGLSPQSSSPVHQVTRYS